MDFENFNQQKKVNFAPQKNITNPTSIMRFKWNSIPHSLLSFNFTFNQLNFFKIFHLRIQIKTQKFKNC